MEVGNITKAATFKSYTKRYTKIFFFTDDVKL